MSARSWTSDRASLFSVGPAHDGYVLLGLGGPVVGTETHARAPGKVRAATLDTKLAARGSLKTGLGLTATVAVPQ